MLDVWDDLEEQGERRPEPQCAAKHCDRRPACRSAGRPSRGDLCGCCAENLRTQRIVIWSGRLSRLGVELTGRFCAGHVRQEDDPNYIPDAPVEDLREAERIEQDGREALRKAVDSEAREIWFLVSTRTMSPDAARQLIAAPGVAACSPPACHVPGNGHGNSEAGEDARRRQAAFQFRQRVLARFEALLAQSNAAQGQHVPANGNGQGDGHGNGQGRPAVREPESIRVLRLPTRQESTAASCAPEPLRRRCEDAKAAEAKTDMQKMEGD